MFVHYRSKGIVINKADRGEADQLFSVYTKSFGRIEILGRAIRKISSKLRPGIDIFYLVEIEFIQGKGYKILTDATPINKFKNLRKSLKRLLIAYRIAEVSDKLIKGEEKDKKIWDLTLEFFEKLDEESPKLKDLDLLFCYFLFNFLSELGYEIELYDCVSCKRRLSPNQLFFSPESGGIVCSNCIKKIGRTRPIEVSIVKILRLIIKRDWETLDRIKLESTDKKLLRIICRQYLLHALSS